MGKRFHVEGQTSIQGERYQIWDNIDGHFARFKNIASKDDADAICDMLNEHMEVINQCALKFDYYRECHEAKNTPDADKKAKVNADMVAMCIKALGED